MTTSALAVHAYFDAFGKGHSRESAAQIAHISYRTAGTLEKRYLHTGVPLLTVFESVTPQPEKATAPLSVIGERLRSARLAVQMTQVDLSKAIGVTQSTLSRWESGKELPLDENQDALCRTLGIAWINIFAPE